MQLTSSSSSSIMESTLSQPINRNKAASARAVQTPKVYVVDDDDAVRRALAVLMESIGYECIAFSSATEYLAQFGANQAGCLVLDIRMPEMTGLELQMALKERAATIPIIFITGHGDVPMAVEAMKKGAFAFIQKPFRDQDLVDRVNHALRRDRGAREDMERREDSHSRWQTLTPREREVCHFVVGGLSNKEVGDQLGLSERTVEIHRGRVMAKMGVRAIAELVHKYALLPPDEWHPASGIQATTESSGT